MKISGSLYARETPRDVDAINTFISHDNRVSINFRSYNYGEATLHINVNEVANLIQLLDGIVNLKPGNQQ